MISIPETIKELYHQDHAYKNIRIHFPNGERSDICNDLIVKDSVSFTESLCSQNTLKFGLCEASIFECEVVGVGNIKGATIEVYCEIECPLSVTGAEWRVDIQKYVYTINYGTFEVQEAKRQSDMIHRKITAYGGSNLLAGQNSILDYKALAFANSAIAYQPDIFSTMLMCTKGQEIIEGVTMEEVGEFGTVRLSRMPSQQGSGAGKYFLAKRLVIDSSNEDDLYYIPEPGIISDDVPTSRYGRGIGVMIYRPEIHTQTSAHNEIFLPLTNKGAYFYPYQLMNKTESTQLGTSGVVLYIAYRTMTVLSDLTPTYSEFYRNKDDCKIYKINRSNYPIYKMNVERTEGMWGGSLGVGLVYDSGYTFEAASVDYYSMFKEYMELQGKFFTLDRNNAPKIVDIKRQFGLLPEVDLYPGGDLYPENVTGGKLLPEDYQACWYDDDYSKLYGRITAKYKDSNNADQVYDHFFQGFSSGDNVNSYLTYDISQNKIISSWRWTENEIKTICEAIANSLEGVRYMPVDFKGRGLPYVEAGDTFEIFTRSSDSITTIVLNRTLTGEMTLTDTYKSV